MSSKYEVRYELKVEFDIEEFELGKALTSFAILSLESSNAIRKGSGSRFLDLRTGGHFSIELPMATGPCLNMTRTMRVGFGL